MERNMRKIGIFMSLYMGLVMSIFMTITGVCVGMLPGVIQGKIPPHAILLSMISGFFVSFCISLLIGFMVPMHKLTQSATKKMDAGLAKKCVESLISDLIYTPVISVVMVSFAYMSNQKQEAGGPSFIMMLIPSLIACFIVGYILIFIFQPFIFKRLMKRFGSGKDGAANARPDNKKK